MKTFLILLISFVFSFAGVWSSLSSSGRNGAYSELNSFVNSNNNEIKNFWDNEIKNLMVEIEKESKEREKNLKQLEALNKELLLNKEELYFLLKQNNELLGIEADINAF